MTFYKFRRTLCHAGWSCYWEDGEAYISRGRFQIVVCFDDCCDEEGYFYFGDDLLSVADISSITFFRRGAIFWHCYGGGYRAYY